MHGVLNLYKPVGPTSHDVVKRIRKLTGTRVGHAGTLDPNATGVLLLCLGNATRVAEYLTACRKAYRGVVRLGTTTDTYDVDGQVLETRPVTVTREQIETALAPFRGSIAQVPPAFSAIKRDGQPLYKLARKGIEVERPPRRVEILELTLEDYSQPDVTLRISCSAGTYIRSLAHDLGAGLGCGAHLLSLERTASGNFTREESVRLSEAEEAARDGRLEQLLHPIGAALEAFPRATLQPDEVVQVRHGRFLTRDLAPSEPESLCCAYDLEGDLVALLRFDTRHQRWQPHKVFAERQQ